MVFDCKPVSQENPDSILSRVTRRKQDSPLHSLKNENYPNEEANQTFSFFLIMHGDSYVNIVELFVKGIDGIESVRHDGNFKLGVMGKVDPFKFKEMVKHATNKEVELILPLAELKGDRDENKASKAKLMRHVMPITENEVANVKTGKSIIDLKIKLCCESCNKNLRKILKTKGLEMLTIDTAKDLVSVKGKVDVTKLRSYIKDKLKKDIEVVNLAKVMDPSKKDNMGGFWWHDEGVEKVSVTAGKDQVMVTGTMDLQELTSYLKEKIKSDMEVALGKRKDKKDEDDDSE